VATLETAKRCLLGLSFVFLVVGIILTAVGFAARPRNAPTQSTGFLALQVGGPHHGSWYSPCVYEVVLEVISANVSKLFRLLIHEVAAHS